MTGLKALLAGLVALFVLVGTIILFLVTGVSFLEAGLLAVPFLLWAALGYGTGLVLKRDAERRGRSGEGWLVAWVALWLFAPLLGPLLLLVVYAVLVAGGREEHARVA